MAALIEPALDEILAFCAEDPIERVFLEDVARRGLGRFTGLAEDGRLRALCHVGTNLVPSGSGCGVFAGVDGARRARLVIGEENAVGDFWAEARHRLGTPREDRPGQPVYVLDEPPEPGETALVPRRRTTSTCSSPPAPRRTARSSGSTRSRATRRASAGGRGCRSRTAARGSGSRTADPVQGGGVGLDALGRAAPAGLGRPDRPRPRLRQRGMRDLCRLLLERVPAVCLFVRAENAPAIRVYENVGMRHTISYRSLVFI